MERTRPTHGSDLVLTEWTDSQSRLTKMKNQSWVWCFLEVSAADYGAPKTPWGSGSSNYSSCAVKISPANYVHPLHWLLWWQDDCAKLKLSFLDRLDTFQTVLILTCPLVHDVK